MNRHRVFAVPMRHHSDALKFWKNAIAVLRYLGSTIDHSNILFRKGLRVPGNQIGLTLASVVMIGCGQILFKLAARDAIFDQLNWHSIVSWLSPAMMAALTVSTVAAALWVWVLRSASLSVVQPLYALTFVLVPLLEWILFDTELTARHGLGAGAIVLDIWLMASAT